MEGHLMRGWGWRKTLRLFIPFSHFVNKLPELQGMEGTQCVGHYNISLEWEVSSTLKGGTLSPSFSTASAVPE